MAFVVTAAATAICNSAAACPVTERAAAVLAPAKLPALTAHVHSAIKAVDDCAAFLSVVDDATLKWGTANRATLVTRTAAAAHCIATCVASRFAVCALWESANLAVYSRSARLTEQAGAT